jgi:ABC-2 type transport system ATP-binding protein
MTDPAIEVSGLSFAYDDKLAVDGVTFDVAPGEVLGFLGPNGAGKSTTIKLITGQLPPKGGTLRVLGHDVATEREKVQARIGVSFEEKNLYVDMSAAENLKFFAQLFGIKSYDPEPMLSRVGLADRMNDRVSEYSKGMRQRVMIARALVNQPDVLVLDEPTDGLDPVSSKAIRELIRAEAERGAAVLLTTHDMLEADSLADRIAFIDEGRVLALDTAENLKLEHGKRNVRVRSRHDGEVKETVIPLDDDGAAKRVEAAVAEGGLLSVHTEEATLEDIFIHLAGRGLSA